MNILQSETFTWVLTILTFSLNIRMCILQITNEETPDPEIINKGFENFLNGLRSMVYKYKTAPATALGNDRQPRNEYSYSSTLPTQTSMRNETLLYTQKAALRDVLMMKLVSYYENKYKITDHVSATADISVQNGNNTNDDDALNEMKRTEHTQSNLKSKRNEAYDEVLVI